MIHDIELFLIDLYMYLRDIHQRFMYTNAPQTYQHVGDGKNKSHLPPKDAVFSTKKQDEGTYAYTLKKQTAGTQT